MLNSASWWQGAATERKPSAACRRAISEEQRGLGHSEEHFPSKCLLLPVEKGGVSDIGHPITQKSNQVVRGLKRRLQTSFPVSPLEVKSFLTTSCLGGQLGKEKSGETVLFTLSTSCQLTDDCNRALTHLAAPALSTSILSHPPVEI